MVAGAGYTLVLPPGWERIPARQGADDAIKSILDAKFRELPPDLPRDKLAPYRAEIEGKLRRAAAQARKNGAIDLYLPVQLRNGLPVPASFVVSEGAIPTADVTEPAQIVSYLVNEDTDGSAVTVDGVARRPQRADGRPGPGPGHRVRVPPGRLRGADSRRGRPLAAVRVLHPGRGRPGRPGRPDAGAVVRRGDVHVPLGYRVTGAAHHGARKEPSSA